MTNPLTPEVLADPVALTRALVDIESVSGNEKELADLVEEVLRAAPHLTVDRYSNTLMARTDLGRPQRVVLAGHLDTVPLAGNFPSTVVSESGHSTANSYDGPSDAAGRLVSESGHSTANSHDGPSDAAGRLGGELMFGCGTSDMKSGVALALSLAVGLPQPRYDVTYFFYEAEEVESDRNGLYLVSQAHPEWLTADFAMLLEPTHGAVEAGCQGTLRAIVRVPGKRAHSARSWRGVNAIHAAGRMLARLEEYQAREVTIDGCHYREGLNAVRIHGGIAGNVIPDSCEIEVNYRFAPDRTPQQAEEHVRELFDGYQVDLVDLAQGALPGLTAAPAREFLAAVGTAPAAKLGWTDVARFAALGVPALNFGPGDPNLAHSREEHVEIDKIRAGAAVLHRWLAG